MLCPSSSQKFLLFQTIDTTHFKLYIIVVPDKLPIMFSTSFGNDIFALLEPFFLSGLSLYFSAIIFKSMILEIRGQKVKTEIVARRDIIIFHLVYDDISCTN
ncbi:hypothetical protein BpHYR1_023750 [Brachionus plicatilis]|uniref:Uncharacterized protein n=1 Tax=Brachionus plicatilis TaxID=10195 RepID=A0A3M7RQC7_BRAPC|nr:hypothetical protein BpHYR1_023750 [Brachionus plicatilis]